MGKRTYLLPTVIVGPADVNRTLVELHQLDEYLEQLVLRKNAEQKLPKTTPSLDRLAADNTADLMLGEDRDHLIAFLESLQQHAPVLHISFASEPSVLFTGKIVEWLRNNVSRYALVQVGLQPSIAAGCIVRSTNKIFDMSLRRQLQQNKTSMIDMLHKVRDREQAA
jgi:F0F1-type ATP synthase delta subunit